MTIPKEQFSTEDVLTSPRSETELLLLAEQVSTRCLVVAREMASTLGRELIGLYDSPVSVPYAYRLIAARAAGILANQYPEVLELVMENAQRYADIERNIDDADLYSPNSITVLKENGPRCEKVFELLRGILRDRPGLADAEVREALLEMGASG